MFSKLAYAMMGKRLPNLGMGNKVKWDIKLCISVNIYCKLLKLGMSPHVFKISLYYDEKL